METTEKIVLAVIFALLFVAWMGPAIAMGYIEEKDRKRRGEPPKEKALYDERQRTIRLQASQWTLLALVGYLILWAVLHLGGWFEWTNEIVGWILCGGVLSAAVWQGYCILHDAVVGWNQKPEIAKTQKLLYFVYGFVFLSQAYTWWNDEPRKDAIVVVCLFASVCMWVLTGLSIYSDRRRKKAEKCAVEEE